LSFAILLVWSISGTTYSENGREMGKLSENFARLSCRRFAARTGRNTDTEMDRPRASGIETSPMQNFQAGGCVGTL
jgi:hypothetical protein